MLTAPPADDLEQLKRFTAICVPELNIATGLLTGLIMRQTQKLWPTL
jgi:hypothetical protein